MLAYAILVFVILQRLAELVLARRNTKALLAQGAVEVGAAHYKVIVLLHVAWLAAIALRLPSPPAVNAYWLVAFAVLQTLRLWVLATLGRYWTTRIIVPKQAPLIRKGPYRFLRHPNYWVVAGEIFVLPMVFGEWQVAAIFFSLNIAVLALRIRTEEKTFAMRAEP